MIRRNNEKIPISEILARLKKLKMTRTVVKKLFLNLVNKFTTFDEDETLKLDFLDRLKEWDKDRAREYSKTFGSYTVFGATDCEVSQENYLTKPKIKFTIFFVNNYPNSEELRKAVVHEFTHLFLFWKKIRQLWNGNQLAKLEKKDWTHEHDDFFYSQMDYFENWLDKELSLSPRKNKEHDRIQHINPNKRKNCRDKEDISQNLESHIQILEKSSIIRKI